METRQTVQRREWHPSVPRWWRAIVEAKGQMTIADIRAHKLERSARVVANARRAVAREARELALFPELRRWVTVEDRLNWREAELRRQWAENDAKEGADHD